MKSEEFNASKDLLNPKWKGKIAVFDPTVPGAGSNTAAQFYIRFGEEFVKKLYVNQKPVITRNRRQLYDWLARGTYPISPDVGRNQVKRLQEEGFPVVTIASLADAPGILSAGSALLGLMNKAPRPNAARVFVNWIASEEGLQVLSLATLRPTTRNDIDESFLLAKDIPRPGLNYFDSVGWKFTVEDREKVRLRKRDRNISFIEGIQSLRHAK